MRVLEGHTVVFYHIPQYRDIPAFRQILAHQSQQQNNIDTTSSLLKKTKKIKRNRMTVSTQKWEIFKKQTQVSNEQCIYIRKSTKWESLAEFAFLIRPIVYLICIFRYGKQSWRGWLLSLFLDLLSLAYYTKHSRVLNNYQKDEASRRTSLLFYYFLRSPFYESVKTPLPLRALSNSLQRLPLLGSVWSSLSDFLAVYREHYFYTSAT